MKATFFLTYAAIVAATAAALGLPAATCAQDRPNVDQFLSEGSVDDGVRASEAWLAKHPDDNEALFGLGALQFVQGVEGLTQDLHRYGLRDVGRGFINVPFLRLPIPENAEAEPLDYKAARGILIDFAEQCTLADRTLAKVNGPVKLPLRLGAIRIDIDRDGQLSKDERLWSFVTGDHVSEDTEKMATAFDRADVHWLRGYCHLLTAMCEVALAYDSSELFNRTGHVFFANAQTPYPFVNEGRYLFDLGAGADLIDLVAIVHLINFPIAEPERLAAAHGHLKSVIVHSRKMWEFAEAETDDDREWIPNARQQSGPIRAGITQAMINEWRVFLDEADALLDGKKLMPFWRGEKPVGVNLHKVFFEPRRFDLVLWVQGTDAAPYLEEGEISDWRTWRRLQETFRGNFWGFALWFN